MDSSSTIRYAKIASISSNFLLAGYTLSLSQFQNGISQTYDMPAKHNVPLFARVFNTGAYVAPPVSTLGAVASGYLLWAVPSQRKVWGIIFALGWSMSFWTLGVMLPGIKRLIRISESEKAMEKADVNLEHRQLLIKWVRQNYVRSVVAAVSAVLGLSASIA